MCPVSQISSMFISSMWDLKEPKHYSRRVGDKVPGVVAVLFFPAEVACLALMFLKKACGIWGHLSRNSHKSKRDFAECWNM